MRSVIVALVLAVLISGCPVETPRLVVFSDPLTAEEHAKLGAIYEKEGDLDRAAEEYMDAVKKDPTNLVALTGLGNVALSREKYTTAIGYYKQALRIDPENAVVHNNLGMAYLGKGNSGRALEHAEKAVKFSEGKDPRMLDTRASAHEASGNMEAAKEDLETAARLCDSIKEGDGNMDADCELIKERLEDFGNKND